MMTFEQILTMPLSGAKRSEIAQKLSDDLVEWSKDPGLGIDRQALLAAASGALLGLRDISARREAAPAAAGQPDNLTSLDL